MMINPPQPPESPSPNSLERLLDVVQLPVRIAQQGLGITQVLCLANLLSTGWLVFFLWHTFHSPVWLLGIAAVVFILPSLVIGQLYLLLLEVSGLTERVGSLLKSAQQKAIASHALITSNLTGNSTQRPKARGFQIQNLFSLGGQLLEIKSLGEELLGLTSVTGSMMMLANPIFLVVCAIAIGFTAIGVFISIITLIIFLL